MSEPRAVSAPEVDAEARVVAARTHGRYLLRRPSPAERSPELLVIGFHGYRENAKRHLAELVSIPGAERWALAAVDALHAFYASSTGEVIRGWMTRELRDEAIADNVAYVRTVVEELRGELGWQLPLAFVGFSQGASMAWRAALLAGQAGEERPAVVAFAGDIPPELDRLTAPFPERVLLVHGDADGWYAGKVDADRELLRRHGVEPEVSCFAGGHEWTDAARAAIGDFLARVSRAD